MARPRKDSEEPCARARIIEAFWQLVEEERHTNVSVGAVTRAAGCNRGTFYYHFKDVDALIDDALDGVLLDDGAIVDALFCVMRTGELDPLEDECLAPRLHRIMLVLDSGTAHKVRRIVNDAVLQRWEELLASEGRTLTHDGEFAIRFMLSGVVGYLLARGNAYEAAGAMRLLSPSDDARAYVRSVSEHMIATLRQ